MIDLNEIEKAAIAATGMNFDSAQAVHIGDGFIECPHCCGSGEVELAADYCNFDGAAIGVQFYGVGTEHVSAEQFYRAVNPSAVIELIECLRQAEKDAARYRWLLDNCTTQQADSCGPIFVMTIRRNKNPNNVGLSIDEAMNA